MARCLLMLCQADLYPAEVQIMSISFDKALGIHEKALGFRAQRAEVLANNIANADTPNYKARDLDFSSVLAAQSSKNRGEFGVALTSSKHIAAEGMEIADPGLRFRTPAHASLDQNTVDAPVEQAANAGNAIDFLSSFTLLHRKIRGLMGALRGD